MRSRTVKWLEETDILEVRYAGEITYEYRLGTLGEIEQATPSGGLRRLLINYTSAWPAERQREPGAVATFGKRIAMLRFAEAARVALVNAPNELGERTENASVAAGFVFRRFNDRAAAIAWLLE
jgi:hypothetical protein